MEQEQVSTETVEQTSGLPSDEVEVTPFVTDEALEDGKFQGKWNSAEEMATHIKNMEDKYANLSRDISDKEKQENETKTQEEVKSEQLQLQEQTAIELVPEFLENGIITDEMMTKLKDVGLDERDIKASAFELKTTLDNHYGYVGGKENYNIIMDYHADLMTDEEKVSFNNSITKPNLAEATLVGLKVMYEQKNGIKQERIRGDVATSSAIKPYSDRADIFKDRQYLQSQRGRNDKVAKDRHRQRLDVTDPSVYS